MQTPTTSRLLIVVLPFQRSSDVLSAGWRKIKFSSPERERIELILSEKKKIDQCLVMRILWVGN